MYQNWKKVMSFENYPKDFLLFDNKARIVAIDICEQRNLLASGSNDNTIKLWNLWNNSLIQTYSNVGKMIDIKFSNEGNLLAFGGELDVTIKVVNISDLQNANNVTEIFGPKNTITRFAFSNNSKYLMAGSFDQIIRIWDCQSLQNTHIFNSKGFVNGVAFKGDNTMIASNLKNGKIKIWNLLNKKLECCQPAHAEGYGVQFSNNLKMLVSSGVGGQIKLWSLEILNSGKLILIRQFKMVNNRIWTVLCSPCSKFIISLCNRKSSIYAFNLQSGEKQVLFKPNFEQDLNLFVGIAISKNLNIIALCQNNKIVICKKQ